MVIEETQTLVADPPGLFLGLEVLIAWSGTKESVGSGSIDGSFVLVSILFCSSLRVDCRQSAVKGEGCLLCQYWIRVGRAEGISIECWLLGYEVRRLNEERTVK
jgi:hypothetical protein